MSGAVLVAIGAAVGNLLQGWDNATIAGNLFSSSSFTKAIYVCVKVSGHIYSSL